MMNHSSMVRFLQVNRSIAQVRDGETLWRLPERRAGRFAACAVHHGAVGSVYDAGRAAAVERSGLPRRYARAILF